MKPEIIANIDTLLLDTISILCKIAEPSEVATDQIIQIEKSKTDPNKLDELATLTFNRWKQEHDLQQQLAKNVEMIGLTLNQPNLSTKQALFNLIS